MAGPGRRSRRQPFELAGNRVRPGHRAHMALPISRLISGTPVAIPAIVLHGRSDGPLLWITAAIHGDEIAGIEIIRLVLGRLDPRSLRGTVVALPIVNVQGFNTGDRYLPDRRDLNRSFPGSARGSLAARIAHLLMTEVVERSDIGIDLHTGAAQRTNLPQIRANLDDLRTAELAAAFGAPIAIHARTRDGSLRQAATDVGVTVLLYEGGEASRYDKDPIDTGVAGILRIMAETGMLDAETVLPVPTRLMSTQTVWSRAMRSGILHLDVELGEKVERNEAVATIYDPYGKKLGAVRSRASGLVIGQTRNPLVNRGDAVVHVAQLNHIDVPPRTWVNR